MTPTITDIARQAKTSAATVSRVLRHDPSFLVSQETRERVLKIAARLRYRPNRTARFFQKGKTGTISVALSQIATTHWVWRQTLALTLEVIQGVQSAANQYGYNVTLFMPRDADMEDAFHREIMGEQRVDGIVLFGDTCFARFIPQLQAEGIRCISFSPQSAQLAVPVVEAGSIHAIQDMVAAVRSLGHRTAGCISSAHVPERLKAFGESCLASAIRMDAAWCATVQDEAGAYRATKKTLQRAARPSLLFFTSDHFAVAGLDAIREEGLRVPDDISVVGFDDAGFLPQAMIPLATIQYPRYELGRLAAKTLLAMIDGEEVTADTLSLRCKFIPRKSLGPVHLHGAPKAAQSLVERRNANSKMIKEVLHEA